MEIAVAVMYQTDPVIREDLKGYAGSWVAIRDGAVVASALDPVELRDMPEVHEDDLLMPVPDRPDGIYIM
ncbi:MAG: hypothetical protein ACYCSI_05335 [Solirubrobacteraceae bacterium]